MEIPFWIFIVGAVILAAIILMAVLPRYSVWSSRMEGQANLAEAEYQSKVQIHNAEGQALAAKHLAQAEIERSKGVAEANKIIGDSLKGNDGYLRWLWINGLQSQNNTTIYIPTEAGLPILEAGKRS